MLNKFRKTNTACSFSYMDSRFEYIYLNVYTYTCTWEWVYVEHSKAESLYTANTSNIWGLYININKVLFYLMLFPPCMTQLVNPFKYIEHSCLKPHTYDTHNIV